ncbi:GDSL family lipase, partial [Klebsiella pneumoniae]
TVNGANTGAAKKHDISGLSATAHSVTIQSLGSGVVSILGMYGKNSAVRSGVTVSRMGNGGAIGSDFFNFSEWIKPVAQYLDIDLLFVILGTNDF